jgi:Fe-S-cluster containining protein
MTKGAEDHARWQQCSPFIRGKTDARKLDCKKCGACCMGQIVPVQATDNVPILMVADYFMRQVGGRCVALVGALGRETSCTIYKQRPAVCRALKKGSWACLAIRSDWGF